MTELEFLEDLEESIDQRLSELSDILSRMDDTTTKIALANNHKNGMLELEKVKQRISQINTKNISV